MVGRARTQAPLIGAAIIGVGLVALAVLDVRHGTLRDGIVPQTIGWYLLAFTGFVVAAFWNERFPVSARWLWGFAILFRVVMLTTSPTLSDDVYRYLWDGHLVAEGVNPYEFAIDDPAGDPYEIPARELANNRTLSSPYLPTVHAVFGAAALLLPSEPIVLQALMVAFDLIAAVLLAKLLALAHLPARRLLLYLWNPFVIVEIAHGAHLDALMIMLMLAGFLLTWDDRDDRIRQVLAPMLHAFATLTRVLPVLALPVLFWRWSWPQRLTYAATCLAIIVPFALGPGFGLVGESTGTGVFGSARAYTETFRFNASIYFWLERWIGSRGLDDKGWNEPVALTRLIVAVLFVAIMAVLWWRARHRVNEPLPALRLMVAPFAAYVLLAPVMHPWYVMSLVVLVILTTPAAGESARRWLLSLPWLYLTAAMTFSYLTYEVPEAHAERSWVRNVEWIPTIALLAVALVVVWSQQRSPAVRREQAGVR